MIRSPSASFVKCAVAPSAAGLMASSSRIARFSPVMGSSTDAGSAIGACSAVSYLNRDSLLAALRCTRRFYFQSSHLFREETSNTAEGHPLPQQHQQNAMPPPGDGEAAATATNAPASERESALDVAMRVNKLKKLHQTGGAGSNKKEIEREAWHVLNSLTEEQINSAEGKAVSLLLNAWAYFAKFWGKGKDGPL